MPRGYPALNETQKKEIISRVTDNGEKVSELSKEYGVVSKTIYKLYSAPLPSDHHFQKQLDFFL